MNIARLIITDEGLFLRLRNFEDYVAERKSKGDTRDVLQTAVAFANSTPIGRPVLFVGVRDDGSIEGDVNLDTLQGTVPREIAKAYPSVFHVPRVLREADKRQQSGLNLRGACYKGPKPP